MSYNLLLKLQLNRDKCLIVTLLYKCRKVYKLLTHSWTVAATIRSSIYKDNSHLLMVAVARLLVIDQYLSLSNGVSNQLLDRIGLAICNLRYRKLNRT